MTAVLFFVTGLVWCFINARALFGPRCWDCHLEVPILSRNRKKWSRPVVAGRARWLCYCCRYERAKAMLQEAAHG